MLHVKLFSCIFLPNHGQSRNETNLLFITLKSLLLHINRHQYFYCLPNKSDQRLQLCDGLSTPVRYENPIKYLNMSFIYTLVAKICLCIITFMAILKCIKSYPCYVKKIFDKV